LIRDGDGRKIDIQGTYRSARAGYGIDVVRAKLRGERLPLPLAAASDTS
jgi:hypothetical protein